MSDIANALGVSSGIVFRYLAEGGKLPFSGGCQTMR
jgi:hypothetical protein